MALCGLPSLEGDGLRLTVLLWQMYSDRKSRMRISMLSARHLTATVSMISSQSLFEVTGGERGQGLVYRCLSSPAKDFHYSCIIIFTSVNLTRRKREPLWLLSRPLDCVGRCCVHIDIPSLNYWISYCHANPPIVSMGEGREAHRRRRS